MTLSGVSTDKLLNPGIGPLCSRPIPSHLQVAPVANITCENPNLSSALNSKMSSALSLLPQ